jgi:hypothetical protein
MKRLVLLLAAAALTGCGLIPKHEVNLSPKLTEHPVASTVIFDPVFADKVKRRSPTDLAEMLPEHQQESADAIRKIVTAVVGTTVTVDTAYQPDRLAQEWAKGILGDLAKGRVPLNVDPINIPAETVLLLGAPTYGTEDMQWHMNILWFKDMVVGPKKSEYVCDLQALLVNPHDGAVLFDVRNEYREKAVGAADPEHLLSLTRSCAGEIANAFHPPATPH